jgi:hypothetical protein
MSDQIDFAAELERLKNENEVLKEVIRLQTENADLRKTASQGLSLKVSDKGGVSVYGLGRFPVTLYKEQWHRLLSLADHLRTFIKENEAKLRSRD